MASNAACRPFSSRKGGKGLTVPQGTVIQNGVRWGEDEAAFAFCGQTMTRRRIPLSSLLVGCP